MATVTLNVSGKRFTIGTALLRRYPNTRLGRLSTDSPEYEAKTDEFFFDRNPKIILAIFDLFRTGELHLPTNLCSFAVKKELAFWEISEDMISECCWKRYSSAADDMKAVDIIEKSFWSPSSELTNPTSLQQEIWLTMESPSYSLASKIWFSFYIFMVIVAVVTACLTMSPELRVPMDHFVPEANGTTILDVLLNTEMNEAVYVIDIVCLLFFTVELLIRFMLCPQRRVFFKRPLNVLDLVLTSGMWMSLVLDHIPQVEHAHIAHTALRSLFCLNVLRIFHIGKNSQGMQLLIFTIHASLEAFGLLLVSLTMAVVILASAVFFAEVVIQTDSFSDIPFALWWAVITMTTVGYGDFYPQSWAGYIVGVICALSGILLLAMPIAIIASNFNTYYSNMSSAEQRARRKKALTVTQSSPVTEREHIKDTPSD